MVEESHYEEAIGLLQDIIRDYPREAHDENFCELGRAFLKLGRGKDGLPFLQKALQISPFYSYGYYILGLIYKSVGKWNDAVEAFTRSLHLRVTQPQEKSGYFIFSWNDEEEDGEEQQNQ